MTRRALDTWISPKSRRLLVTVAIILLGAALRFYRLGADSLWYDETVSLLLAGKPLVDMIAHTARDIHPPAYYLLLNLWTRLAGRTEFAAAWPSFAAGVLLLPMIYVMATRLLHRAPPYRGVPLLASALAATSVFNVWYSQEVRMYTLGAGLGLAGGYAAWRLLEGQMDGADVAQTQYWWVFVLASALGLYTLYYYAFLLVSLAAIIAVIAWRNRLSLMPWIQAAGATLFLWLPWIPVAFRQSTEPPVPPWRSLTPFAQVIYESFTVLTFGHSFDLAGLTPQRAWLLPALAFYLWGLWWLWRQTRRHELRRFVPLLLFGWTWGPMLLIELFSVSLRPLYHPRYVFTYSPPFYIVLAAGLVGVARGSRVLLRFVASRRVHAATQFLLLVVLLAGWSGLTTASLYNFWYDPHYAADDLRGGMRRLEERWYPGDALLVNAGYVYPAVNYYFGGPIAWQGRLINYEGSASVEQNDGLIVLQTGSLQGKPSLGWGRPDSDFYVTSPSETLAALEEVADTHPRLWMLRAYDTVTDPDGVIREWLSANGMLFYDELLRGPSNFRLQGWLMPAAFAQQPRVELPARFLDGASEEPRVELAGYDTATAVVAGGETLDLTLYLRPLPGLDAPVRISLGLFDAEGRQWAVEDTLPLGPLLSLHQLPVNEAVPVPVRLKLPPGLPPDAYEVRLKLYWEQSGRSLVAQGETAANEQQVRVLAVQIRPTPDTVPPPQQIQYRLGAEAGPLHLLGANAPTAPLQVGEYAEVELLWQLDGRVPVDLIPRLVAEKAIVDGGGLAAEVPMSQWPADALIRDVHEIMVRPDARPGEYTIKLQLIDGGRTLEWGGLIRARRDVAIAPLTIVDRPRQFEAPPIKTEINAMFGDAIRLVGYDVQKTTARPGDEVVLELVWQAQARPRGRYKVFTHLVGPDGEIHGQRDLEPGRGRLPTNGWAPEEYVVMEYAIPVDGTAPAGTYELRLGLYDPDTGVRVPVQHPQANTQEQYLSLAAIEIGN